MRAASVILCVAAAGGCSPASPRPRPPLREVCAEVPPCPSWIEAFRDRPTTLHVHVVDRGCAPGTKIGVQVMFDAQELAKYEIACAGTSTPTRRLEGPKVTPGLHELVVRTTHAAGALEAAAMLSLPAFDVAGDGKNATLGSEVVVDVGTDDLSIEPPLVYPPHDL